MNYSDQTLLKSLNDEELDEVLAIQTSIRADECNAVFYEFFLEFWPEVVPAELVPNFHLKFICNKLQEKFEIWEKGGAPGDVVINIPPGMSKSTIVTVMFPAWVWVRKRSTRLITCSYASGLALDHAVKSRDLIKSDKFQTFYPDHVQLKQDVNNKGLYENQYKGRRLSTSVGATVTGFHGDILITDDPVNPEMAFSEVARESANKWLEQTLSNRKTDKKRSFMITVMQRLHEEDPTGRILDIDAPFYHICLPARITDLDNIRPRKLKLMYKDGLLDPARMDHKVLDIEQKRLGSMGFVGQYLQSPRAAEGNIFKREWFEMYEELPKSGFIRRFDSWDTAYKIKQENDFSVKVTFDEYDSGFYLTDFWMGKVEYAELKQQIRLSFEKNKTHNILIEDKASGQSAIQELNRMNLPIYGIIPQGDKILRANQITPPFEAGNVYFPYEDFTQTIIDQLTGFPNTTHDDIVDAISQALNWARENAGNTVIVSSGKRKATKITSRYRY